MSVSRMRSDIRKELMCCILEGCEQRPPGRVVQLSVTRAYVGSAMLYVCCASSFNKLNSILACKLRARTHKLPGNMQATHMAQSTLVATQRSSEPRPGACYISRRDASICLLSAAGAYRPSSTGRKGPAAASACAFSSSTPGRRIIYRSCKLHLIQTKKVYILAACRSVSLWASSSCSAG